MDHVLAKRLLIICQLLRSLMTGSGDNYCISDSTGMDIVKGKIYHAGSNSPKETRLLQLHTPRSNQQQGWRHMPNRHMHTEHIHTLHTYTAGHTDQPPQWLPLDFIHSRLSRCWHPGTWALWKIGQTAPIRCKAWPGKHANQQAIYVRPALFIPLPFPTLAAPQITSIYPFPHLWCLP